MLHIFYKFLNILLIMLISFLVLNSLYIVNFSIKLKNIFLFLSLIVILIIAVKEILIGKSKFDQFIGFVILSCTIVGGIYSLNTEDLSIYIYVSVIFSLVHSLVDLIYSKS